MKLFEIEYERSAVEIKTYTVRAKDAAGAERALHRSRLADATSAQRDKVISVATHLSGDTESSWEYIGTFARDAE